MKYEYNGNLLEEERVNLVANEIIEIYPQISIEKAKKAAMLEGEISNEKNLNMELERLYNIMLVNEENKDIVLLVYKDFINTIKDNQEESTKYNSLLEPINDYINGYLDFPFLSDYQ